MKVLKEESLKKTLQRNRVKLRHTWPKRMAISDFRKIGFVGEKAPSITTLKRWIDKGEIPGEKLGTMYYVWINQTLGLEKPPSAERTSKMSTENEVADRIAARFMERSVS